jgi:hypothetical protein
MWYALDTNLKKLSGVGIISEKSIKHLPQLVAGSQDWPA